MHLKRVTLFPEKYPTREYYPFNLDTFRQIKTLGFDSPVTFFVGENGTGKSTLLEAVSLKCGIHKWQRADRASFEVNPFQGDLYKFITVEWTDGFVPGSYFSGETFRDFSQFLDDWAITDPQMLKYFGGKSLVTQSHGQSLMSYFKSRYQIKGLHFLDEPETALSPRSQLELLQILQDMSQAGHAQFIIASHSPILLACPGGKIWSFDKTHVVEIPYEDTDHYKIYHRFMADRRKYVGESSKNP